MSAREAIGRSWKLVLAVAAVLGALAFVAPFHEYAGRGHERSVSAYRILRGYTSAVQVDPRADQLQPWQQERLVQQANDAIRYREPASEQASDKRRPHLAPYYFVAVAFMIVTAVIALFRRVLGVIDSLVALFAGLCGIGACLRELVAERQLARGDQSMLGLLAEASYREYVWSIGIGVILLGIAGLLASIAGVGGLALADPGGLRKPRPPRIKVPRARVVTR